MIASPATTPTGSIWDTRYLALTVGSILAVTIAAFQGLAVATIAPVLADDIGGRDLYGWIFTAFILPQIIGTVIGGLEVDRRQPAIVFYTSLAFFAVGCAVAGSAPSIFVLFLGRALQGFGAGAMFACVYAIISAVYEDHLRPAMLAAMSSAWIIPSLIGPGIAGFIADHVGWRYVFWGLIPILAIVAPLTWPAFRGVRMEHDIAAANANARRVPYAVALAFGTGLFLAGLDVRPVALGAPIAAAGLAILVPMLKRLLPAGTFVARPMLGGALSSRALCFGGFAVIETYMVFSLKEFGGASTSTAGLVLTLGSLTWSFGSILQARLDRNRGPASRPRRVRGGVSIMLAGTALIFGMVALFSDIWLPVTIAGWLTAGLGIGLAYPTAATIAFAHAPRGQDGLVSSSTLLGDLFTSSVGVGLGGVVLALGLNRDWGAPASAGTAMVLGVAMLMLAWLAAQRLVLARAAGTQ
ncbi:MAG TPA: MFS transporter [Thermomicrobiales bacterium]|nr:MFS transporter [Thermomicrobiales bacterium]